MCFDDGALVPHPPGELGDVHASRLALSAADGAQFAAHLALPVGPAHRVGVLIYPDIRGLHAFYRELAEVFGRLGYPAIAIDYFGRTAGLTERNDAFEHGPHVEQLRYQHILADTHAARVELESHAPGLPLVTLGFCLGGTVSLMAGAHDLGLAGVVGFYAGMKRDFGEGTALEQAPRIAVPVLGLFGGADKGIPAEQVDELDRVLTGTGVRHDVVSYPGAPHSFFDRRAAEHAEATADSWRRVLSFLVAREATHSPR